MNRIIEIIIAPDGTTRLQTRGFQGGNCLEASRFLEEALGEKASDERTPEFYHPACQAEALRQEHQA